MRAQNGRRRRRWSIDSPSTINPPKAFPLFALWPLSPRKQPPYSGRYAAPTGRPPGGAGIAEVVFFCQWALSDLLGGHQAALASPRWVVFSGLSRLGGHQAALASPRWFFFAVGSLGFAWVFFIWFDQVFPELPAGFLGLDWVRVGFYWVFTRY